MHPSRSAFPCSRSLARSTALAAALFWIGALAGCVPTPSEQHVSDALASIREADRQYDLRHIDDARKWIKQALAQSTDADVYTGGTTTGYTAVSHGLIDVLSSHGDYAELALCMNQAVGNRALTNKPLYLRFLGDALRREGKLAESRAVFARLVAALEKEYPRAGSRMPNDRPVQLEIADAQWQAGDYDAAAKNYDDVRRRYPDYADDASNTEAYLAAEDGARLQQAESLALAAVKDQSLKGQDELLAAYRDTLGWVYYKMWRKDRSPVHLAQAITNLEIGATGDPSEADCAYHLAVAYEAAGRTADASILYTRVANMRQADPSAQKDAARFGNAPDAVPAGLQDDGAVEKV